MATCGGASLYGLARLANLENRKHPARTRAQPPIRVVVAGAASLVVCVSMMAAGAGIRVPLLLFPDIHTLSLAEIIQKAIRWLFVSVVQAVMFRRSQRPSALLGVRSHVGAAVLSDAALAPQEGRGVRCATRARVAGAP